MKFKKGELVYAEYIETFFNDDGDCNILREGTFEYIGEDSGRCVVLQFPHSNIQILTVPAAIRKLRNKNGKNKKEANKRRDLPRRKKKKSK